MQLYFYLDESHKITATAEHFVGMTIEYLNMVNSFELYYINYSAVSTEKSYNANTALNLSLELNKSYLIDLFHLLQLPIIYIQFNVVLLYRSSSSQKIPISALKRTLLKAH